jgi:glycosyltransferase involved in cell wall biosynthesis
VQLCYYAYFFSRLAFYKAKEIKQATFPVSIIICAQNEEANLRKYLPKILAQDYHVHGLAYFEVLVVNDNSEDNSKYFLEELSKEFVQLNVLNLTQPSKYMKGKKFPLSMGLKQARFDHVILTDADCEPNSDKWLQEMANGLGQKQIVLAYSPYKKVAGFLNKKIRFETFYAAFQYLSFALAKVPYMGVGRNLAYDRNLFFGVKGFAKHQHILSGDDDLFINEVANSNNTTIVFKEEAFTYSEAEETAEYWAYQKKRHLSTGLYYKGKHKLMLGLLAFSHFYMYVGLLTLIPFVQPFNFLWLIIGVGLFFMRWLYIWLFQMRVMTKMGEDDLIHWIWFFDGWMIGYYIKNIPSIFFKKKVKKWK